MNFVEPIIREFEEKYGLPRDWIEDGIQEAIEKVMTRRYKRSVVVDLDERPFAVYMIGYVDGVPNQFKIPLEKIRGFNTIRRNIELELEARVVKRDYENILKYENTLVWGKIAFHAQDDTLYVEAEIRKGEPIMCVCPKRYLSKKERKSGFMRGERRAFYIVKANPVYLNGTPRLEVILGRTSMKLPVLMLDEQIKQMGLWKDSLRMKPLRRICGAWSMIAVSEVIPRPAIISVGTELQERMRVIPPPKSFQYLGGRTQQDTDPYLSEALSTPHDAKPYFMENPP